LACAVFFQVENAGPLRILWSYEEGAA